MSLKARRVSSFIVTATLAAAVTALIGWPSHVNADGKAKSATRQQAALAVSAGAPQNAPLAKNDAKVGDLVISAELAQSDTTPGARVVHLTCRNPTGQKISGSVEVELTRTQSAPMARVSPQPQIAWRHPESVAVEPGETLIRDIPLPESIGGEVARTDKLREQADKAGSVPLRTTYYRVIAVPREPGGARPKGRRSAVSKLSLARGADPDVFGF